MNILLLLTINLCLQSVLGLNASLKMLSYHPPSFNLTFDETIEFPKFQLLLNNQNLSYALTSSDTLAEYFILQVTTP